MKPYAIGLLVTTADPPLTQVLESFAVEALNHYEARGKAEEVARKLYPAALRFLVNVNQATVPIDPRGVFIRTDPE